MANVARSPDADKSVREMTARLYVTPLGNGGYRVTGGAAPHVVTIGQHFVRCDCGDYVYRRRWCKHMVAVSHFLLAAPIDAAGPGLERDVPAPEPEP